MNYDFRKRLHWLPLRRSAASVPMVLFLALGGCLSDRIVPRDKALRRLNSDLYARSKHCDQEIPFLIPLGHDVQESDLLRCEDELLITSCPLSTIPPGCLYLMAKNAPAKDVDG